MIVPPIGAIHAVGTNNLCILVEILSESNYCLLQILSRALALKFPPGAT